MLIEPLVSYFLIGTSHIQFGDATIIDVAVRQPELVVQVFLLL